MKNVWCVLQVSRRFFTSPPAKGLGLPLQLSGSSLCIPAVFAPAFPYRLTLDYCVACPPHKPPACFQGNGLKQGGHPFFRACCWPRSGAWSSHLSTLLFDCGSTQPLCPFLPSPGAHSLLHYRNAKAMFVPCLPPSCNSGLL